MDDLDEEKKIKIFKIEGFMKETDKEEEKNFLFLDIKCESSLYLFSKQNIIRIFCYRMTNHKFWDRFVMGLIFFSSVKLAVDTYLTDDSESMIAKGS